MKREREMIYSKTDFPQKEKENTAFSCDENLKAAEEAYYGEITEKEFRARESRSKIFLFLLVVLACFLSFIFGVSFQKSGLNDALYLMNTVSSGKIPAELRKNKAQTVGKTYKTVYEKYKNEENGENAGFYGGNVIENGDFLYLGEKENTEIEASADINTALSVDGEQLKPVISRNISSYGELSLSNETNYRPDLEKLSQGTPEAFCGVDLSLPTVLVLHTHATESYNESEYDGYYSESVPTRSEDTKKNVVYVGEVLKNYLEDFGICTLHDETLCDKESFVYAYNKSKEIAKNYLDEYPSIKIIIDLHRDSIVAPDGAKTKPVFDYAGEKTAQLMFVVGTDDAGADHGNWEENLRTALYIQKKAEESCPGLFRKINLRKASFNQQLSGGFLLLECGSCANTRAEAENAVKIFACALARMIKESQY